MSYKIDRNTYAQTYGPTTGDRVRLADTELFIEVEKDLTTYGDEVKFGGGKVKLVPYSGFRNVYGFNSLVNGSLDT